jgi:ATP-binding cassette subfamily B protein
VAEVADGDSVLAADFSTRDALRVSVRTARESLVDSAVSHWAWTLRELDRIYVLDDGALVQQGRYDELLAIEHGRFAQIFADQSKS